jgi:hypothetical protein
MTDPVREYGKFKTSERNLLKRYGDRIDRLIVEREQMLATLIDGLSPAAKRIRDAAELVATEDTAPVLSDGTVVVEANEAGSVTLDITDNGGETVGFSIPEKLLKPPTDLPPGALIEGRENGKAKRA